MYSDTLDVGISFDVPVRPMDAKGLTSSTSYGLTLSVDCFYIIDFQ